MNEFFLSRERFEPNDEQKAMFDWANKKGIKWGKIVYPVKFHPGYFGCMAVDDIFPGERIVTAPNSALFTTQVANDSELKNVFKQCANDFSSSLLVLVTFLIWEKFKGPASRWAPFIKCQPKQIVTLQEWLPQEIEELQDIDLKIDVFDI